MKAATILAIVCLSLSALLTFSEYWWLNWLSSSEFFGLTTLRLALATTDVLLLQVPLIIFFVALCRSQGKDGVK